MSGLSLETPKITTTRAPKQKKQPVLDSWEDESSESEHEPPTPTANNGTSTSTSNTPIDPHRLSGLGSGFSAPPPTPASPSYKADNMPWQQQQQQQSSSIATVSEEQGGGGGGGADEKRPEKTDAVARRMIASALGVRGLRPNEEQRAYDRAVREKERKRREEEREVERRRLEEAEKAKAAIWDD